MEIKDWIKAARQHKNWTQQQLGDAIGRTKANVGHWENGLHQPKLDMLLKIAAETGFPAPIYKSLIESQNAADTARAARYLVEQYNSTEHDSPNISAARSTHGPYPLISDVQAGDWTEICDNFASGDAERWLMSAHNLGPHGYLLRVEGKSMYAPGEEYSFAPGMLLHVRPDIDPLPGQFVIVRREESKAATFKRYLLIEGHPYLVAINPDWPKEMKYLELMPGDVWCGVVVDASLGRLP
ncbi:LexA family protein [Corticibacter populi]|nr:XRE family transcriptional regulator [Corticibacter populi]RZS31687.1 SOS-response transcriptional repressor LexA [Corticibacter populi]